MLYTATENNAHWVYSHRYIVKQGETIAVPTNEYQEGSVRDDFDFGPLVLIRTEALRQFLATEPEDMQYGALYQLRLHISRTGLLVHINEHLYTEHEQDTRTSGEKQFDYVDPRNRHQFTATIASHLLCRVVQSAADGWILDMDGVVRYENNFFFRQREDPADSRIPR